METEERKTESFGDGTKEQKEMRRDRERASKRADECVRKPLSRFRQLEKIDHRNSQQGSSQVTAAVVIHTADNKTTAQ